MIKQEMLERLLGVALSTGVDFAEIFGEHTVSNQIQMIDGKNDRVGDQVLSGVGIRIFKGERTVYASTSERALRQMRWEREMLRSRFV